MPAIELFQEHIKSYKLATFAPQAYSYSLLELQSFETVDRTAKNTTEIKKLGTTPIVIASVAEALSTVLVIVTSSTTTTGGPVG